MKKSSVVLSGLTMVFVMSSCVDSKKEEGVEDAAPPMQNEMHVENEEEKSSSDSNLDDGATAEVNFSDERVAAVYEDYSRLKSNLVNSDAKAASESAAELLEAMGETEDSQEITSAAEKISSTEDIDQQRVAFADLTAGVEEMIAGAVVSGSVYKQFCPMAFGGDGGFWLSSSAEVRNPYFGDRMLKCGSVRDTIK